MTDDIVNPGGPATDRREAVLIAYDRQTLRRVAIVAGLVAILVASFLFDLAMGPSSLGVIDTLGAILWPAEVSRSASVIVWDVRMPAAVMAVLVGVALSLAGAEMQTILNNPLASPFTLGVSSAASLGAALAIVLGIGIPGVPESWIVTGNAFIFAFASVLLLQSLTGMRGAGVDSLVMFGIALVFTFNALVALIQFVASADALQQLVFWGMGSLTRSNWESITILGLVTVLTVPFSFRASWKLTALRLGEDRARSFGVDVTRLRFFSLFRISLLAATSVAFVGTIGFIGLVGPHIARLLIGEDHRFFLPASALTGAVVMSLADIASKSIAPGVIVPIGIVTSLVGLPVFFALIFRRRERL
ncbi:FecCD family ABC transporter permease [Neorhizobium sp. DT-125]|uniref:FecCD family ABC transporter permease n=1 Tax=Neorhizobium sp. DT-125 TaxID=3396163 RepID=UPI003F1D54F6